MNCQRCGYLIPNTAAFCPNCGAQKPAVNTPQQAAQAAQYPPNPYLQTPYQQPQANPPQGYAPQPPFQQTPYPPQYPQPPAYPAQPPVRQQSKGMRILIIVVSLLSMIVGLLKIFRVFR